MFNVGAQLRRIRRRANFTLDQLAATSGVDRGTISRIELGHVSPRIDTISFLCEAMGTTLSHFFAAQAGSGEAQEAVQAARPDSQSPGAESYLVAVSAPVPGAPAPSSGPALGEKEGYWPVPSTFWHGLLEVLDRFEALVKNSSELILVQDRAGVILYASPASESILHRRSPDLVGRVCRSLVHPSDMHTFDEFLAVLVPGATGRLDFRLRHKDGTWRWISAKISNLLDNPSVMALVLNGQETTGPAQA
ncbi:MAG: helix-turn-helix domain-containing protein [Holophaga sp.]|jgi:PAS domain S-box-containing protein